MNRFFVPAACLLLAATAWSAAPASAATLPPDKKHFIRSEANNRFLTIDTTVVATAAGDRVQVEAISGKSNPWTFASSGLQAGRVLIKENEGKFLLDYDETADKLKLSPVSPAPSLSQQWRIIEADQGAFLIMNVQTGKLLNTDNATVNNPITGIDLKKDRSTSTPPNNQWRLFSLNFTTETNKGAKTTILPRLQPMAKVPGQTFMNNEVDIVVKVELEGDGTDELKAKVTMTAEGFGTKLEGNSTTPLMKLIPGKKIMLIPGFKTSQECKSKVKATLFDFVDPNLGVVAIPLPPLPPGSDRIISFCMCAGDLGGPVVGKTGVVVHLELIPFLVEVP